jgi:hypothetical protein
MKLLPYDSFQMDTILPLVVVLLKMILYVLTPILVLSQFWSIFLNDVEYIQAGLTPIIHCTGDLNDE